MTAADALDRPGLVRVVDGDRVRTVTLDRVDALNAFNEALYDAFTDTLLHSAEDPGVAVVLFTGSGRAFCAGTDLLEMARDERRELCRHRRVRPRHASGWLSG